VKLRYQGTSNVRKLNVVFSIKRRKFIKARREGDRVAGRYVYTLLPGKYVLIGACSITVVFLTKWGD